MAWETLQTATKHVSKSLDFLGYFELSMSFDVAATLQQESDTLQYRVACQVNGFQETHGWGTVSGDGFINAGGIAFFCPTEDVWTPMEDVSNDTVEQCAADLQAYFKGATQFDSHNIWGIYASDKGNPPSPQGVLDGTRAQTVYIDGDPYEQTINLVMSYQRGHWRNSSGGWAVTQGSDIANVTFQELFPDIPYYPWARRIGGTMASCNRGGGSLKRRESGAWSDVKNSEAQPSTSQGWRFKDLKWEVCPEVGQV